MALNVILSPFLLKQEKGVAFCDTHYPDDAAAPNETMSLQQALAEMASKGHKIVNATTVLEWMYQNLDFKPRA